VCDSTPENGERGLGPQRVGELQLAAGARREALDLVEHVRGQHVPADEDVVGRRLVDRRLLDQVGDRDDTPASSIGPFGASTP
jgi:hypothetical protein